MMTTSTNSNTVNRRSEWVEWKRFTNDETNVAVIVNRLEIGRYRHFYSLQIGSADGQRVRPYVRHEGGVTAALCMLLADANTAILDEASTNEEKRTKFEAERQAAKEAADKARDKARFSPLGGKGKTEREKAKNVRHEQNRATKADENRARQNGKK